MKIYLDGANHLQGQIPRIKQGFIELGYEITDFISCSDLIYSNNPSPTRTQIVKDKKEGKLKSNCKLIFNILDYPVHIEKTESFQKEIPQIKADLAAADAVTSISEYTQKMVLEKYGFESTVIYNPMKEIYNDDIPEIKSYPFLFCGRKYDPNKHVAAGIAALQMLGVSESVVGMIGNEQIGWGSYEGVISDKRLSDFYRLADFSFCLGEVEGIGLGAIESTAARTIPIINSKLTTREEFFPSELFPEYNEINVDKPETIANFILGFYQGNWKKEEFKERLYHHYLNNLKDKFDKVKVAEKIIEIYKNL